MKRIRLADLAELVMCGKVQAAEYCWRCGKIRYPSLLEARSVGARMAAMGKGHTRPYECRRGGWHLTSKVSTN
jgi:hypothetical protein